ncbi:MAG TPA: hypothetical protein VGP16_05245 [Asanoa sp.]|nr:hypothetical protein [Asanoa sp.]
MLATELLTSRRIIAGRCAITHDGELFRGKELELPHSSIISDPRRNNCPVGGFDYAKSMARHEGSLHRRHHPDIAPDRNGSEAVF